MLSKLGWEGFLLLPQHRYKPSTFLARARGAAAKHIRNGEQMAVGVGAVDGSGEPSAEDVAGDLFAA